MVAAIIASLVKLLLLSLYLLFNVTTVIRKGEIVNKINYAFV